MSRSLRASPIRPGKSKSRRSASGMPFDPAVFSGMPFDPAVFLATAALGRDISTH